MLGGWRFDVTEKQDAVHVHVGVRVLGIVILLLSALQLVNVLILDVFVRQGMDSPDDVASWISRTSLAIMMMVWGVSLVRIRYRSRVSLREAIQLAWQGMSTPSRVVVYVCVAIYFLAAAYVVLYDLSLLAWLWFTKGG